MGKIERKVGQALRRTAREDMNRIHKNVLAHRPWWLPMRLWVRIVRIVLEGKGGPARE